MKIFSLILVTLLVSGFTFSSVRSASYTGLKEDESNKLTPVSSDIYDDVYEITPSEKTIYVSITGLKLKNAMSIFTFYRHAIPSLNQAKKADGNISADTNKINGVYHTLSVWESEEKMREFIYSGAHLKAIQAFPKIAEGKTFGYTTKTAPSWEDVHSLWLNHSNNYGAN